MKRFTDLFFFSNVFYGICMVAMTADSVIFQQINLPGIFYFTFIFSASILYYTFAYAGIFKLHRQRKPAIINDKNHRFNWYRKHAITIFYAQIALVFAMAVSLYMLLYRTSGQYHKINGEFLLIALVFPAVSIFYYGHIYFPGLHFTLRNKGLLKPFVIGFVWAGAIVCYPALFNFIFYDHTPMVSLRTIYCFLDYWLFVSILCIMFDIKDYADDANRDVKTFVVKWGLKNTIYKILLPVCLLYAAFSFVKNIAAGVPATNFVADSFIAACLYLVVMGLTKRKPILFYLLVIDGLMLMKALTGIVINWN